MGSIKSHEFLTAVADPDFILPGCGFSWVAKTTLHFKHGQALKGISNIAEQNFFNPFRIPQSSKQKSSHKLGKMPLATWKKVVHAHR